MPPHRVVALVREAEEQARLRGALRGVGALVSCASPNDVLAALSEGSALAVVVPAYGPGMHSAISLTRALRARHPTVPVLIYYDAQHTNPRDLLAFFQAGAAEIVQSGGVISAGSSRLCCPRPGTGSPRDGSWMSWSRCCPSRPVH